jgi:hypothetical protein
MLSNNHQDLARIIPKKQFEATRAKIIHCSYLFVALSLQVHLI